MENIFTRNVENPKNLKYNTLTVDIELKQWLINESEKISTETKTSYENLLYKVDNYESTFANNRSVYGFSKEELLNMLTMFASSSPYTLNVYLSIIRKYIDFAIQHGRLKTGINQANSISFDDLSKIVNHTKNESKFVFREELYYLVEENLINKQDQSMILLLFEGIKGIDNSELFNIKRSDIDEKNLTVNINREIKEKDINGNTIIKEVPIEVKIPRRLMNILLLTNLEKEYKMKNGQYSGKRTGESELMTIEQTPYFFRPITVKDEGTGKLNGAIIQKRVLVNCRDWLGLSFATINSIYTSGVLERLCKHTKEIGKDILSHKEVSMFLEKNYEELNSYQIYVSYKSYFEEWKKINRQDI